MKKMMKSLALTAQLYLAMHGHVHPLHEERTMELRKTIAPVVR